MSEKQVTHYGVTSGPWHCDRCTYASEDKQGDDYGVAWGLSRGSVVCPGCWGEFYDYLYAHHPDLHGSGFTDLSTEARARLRKIAAQWIVDTHMAQPNPRMEAARKVAEAIKRQWKEAGIV